MTRFKSNSDLAVRAKLFDCKGMCRWLIASSVVMFLVGSAYAGSENYSESLKECENKSKNSDGIMLCINSEINFQKIRLNTAYGKISKKISPDDKQYLDEVQRSWIKWRNSNYDFLSEHVAGEFITTRITSLNFLLKAVSDRADELEMILDEMGG